jgi:hypothetical protein
MYKYTVCLKRAFEAGCASLSVPSRSKRLCPGSGVCSVRGFLPSFVDGTTKGKI